MSNNYQFYPPYMQDPSKNQQGQYNQNTNSQYTPPKFENFEDTFYKNLKKKQMKKDLVKAGLILGFTVLCYLIVQILLSSVLFIIPDLYDAYQNSSTIQNCTNVLLVHICSLLIPFSIMFLTNRKRYSTPLVPSKKIGTFKMCAWIGFGMGCCVASDFIVAFLNILSQEVGYELTQSELLKPDSLLSCIALVASTVLAPAVIEEFAFRCCSLGLLKKYGKGFAVVIVSIYFGLIHGNIIQFIFATLVGLILGYITVKTDNVVIAMIVHGLNNSLSVISDVFEYFGSEKLGETISSGLLILFIPIGIISGIYLYNKGYIGNKKPAPTYTVDEFGVLQPVYFDDKETKKKSKDEIKLSLGTKLLCVLPGFLLASPYFIYSIITTIVKN